MVTGQFDVNKPQFKSLNKNTCFFAANNSAAAYLLTVAKSTHGFDGFDRPIYICAQNRVAPNLNFCSCLKISLRSNFRRHIHSISYVGELAMLWKIDIMKFNGEKMLVVTTKWQRWTWRRGAWVKMRKKRNMVLTGKGWGNIRMRYKEGKTLGPGIRRGAGKGKY